MGFQMYYLIREIHTFIAIATLIVSLCIFNA